METRFTKEILLSHSPCSDGLAFAKSLKFDFAKIYDQCERSDWLLWLLRKSGNLDKPKAVELAITCAEHVLEIFEKKYPKDKRPRKAIESALVYLKAPTDENRKAAYAFAVNAADAADAAPAFNPSNAAHAAAFAAFAAAYVDADSVVVAYAEAAGDFACAAVYNHTADRTTELKRQADKIREIIPNPFK